MTREEKGQIIDELTEKFSQNNHFYITDASGLTVAQVNALRRLCFNAGVEYVVYKNTLIRKALERQKANYEDVFKTLKGLFFYLFKFC